MLTALGLPVLLGATGYGVDTAQYYMYQRELQHAVDQAAIGGAWALAYDDAADYETRAEQEYFANQSSLTVADDNDAGPDVRLANYNNGDNNSVLVSATISRDLTFTAMLLNQPATITARAQAAFEAGGNFQACLFAISDETNKTTFAVGGSATVIANCGLGALSCSGSRDADGNLVGTPAIRIDGSAQVETNSIVTCGAAEVPTANQGAVMEGMNSIVDEHAGLPIPKPDPSTPDREYGCTKGKDKTAAPLPGIYSSIVVTCETTFAPGVYFIDGGTLDLSTNDPVVGINVMFVLRNGATVKLGGQGGDGNLTLTPMQEAHFISTPYAADSDVLAGKLILEDKKNYSATPDADGNYPDLTTKSDHKINGNADVKIEGLLYLPNGNVQINGTSDSVTDLCFQISAWTLDVRGNAYLRTLCEVDETTQIGGANRGVRLIA